MNKFNLFFDKASNSIKDILGSSPSKGDKNSLNANPSSRCYKALKL